MPVTEHPITSTSAHSVDHDISRSHYRYILALIILVAAFLRFWNLGTRGLWFDEGYTWGMTQLPWPEFVRGITTRAADMTIYYTLVKLWAVFGQSEFAMRALSALLSLCTVPIVAELGRRLYSRRAGLIAAAMFSVHVFVIRYAQEARTYPLVMFLAALGWLQVARISRDQSHRNWFLFSVISALAVYSHFISGLNLVAQLMTLLFLGPTKLRWRAMLRSFGTIAIFLTPALIYISKHQRDLEWIRPFGIPVLRGFLNNVTGRSGPALLMCFAIFYFLMILALFGVWRAKGPGLEFWAASVPVVGFAFPVVALACISIYQPLFISRYIGFSLLPLLLGTAGLVARVKPIPSSLGAIVLLAALARPLPAYYRAAEWEDDYNVLAWDDFRDTVQYINLRQQPGDGLIVWIPMATPAVSYYGSQHRGFPDYIYPNIGRRYLLPEEMLVRPDPYKLPGIVAQRNRIWIIYTLTDSPKESGQVVPLYFQRLLEREHKLVSEHQFKSLRLAEYSLR